MTTDSLCPSFSTVQRGRYVSLPSWSRFWVPQGLSGEQAYRSNL